MQAQPNGDEHPAGESNPRGQLDPTEAPRRSRRVTWWRRIPATWKAIGAAIAAAAAIASTSWALGVASTGYARKQDVSAVEARVQQLETGAAVAAEKAVIFERWLTRIEEKLDRALATRKEPTP